MKNRNILITGAAGFIGQALCGVLRAAGYKVETLPEGGDVCDPSVFAPYKSNHIGAVVHLAGLISVPESWEKPGDYYHVNVMGTVHALEFCRGAGAGLVLPSSYMYGTPQYLPIDEEHPLAVNNPYAQSKLFSEETARFYGENYGVPVSVLRLFNVYGPGQRQQFLIPNIVRQVVREPVINMQTLTPRRDFVHLLDVCDAMLRALTQTEGYRCFNVGSGKSYSVAETVALCQEVANTHKRVENLDVTRKNEILDVVANCEKIKKALGWEPRVTLEAGLSELIALERAKE